MNEQQKECIDEALRIFAQQEFAITVEGLAVYVEQWCGVHVDVHVIASYIQEQLVAL